MSAKGCPPPTLSLPPGGASAEVLDQHQVAALACAPVVENRLPVSGDRESPRTGFEHAKEPVTASGWIQQREGHTTHVAAAADVVDAGQADRESGAGHAIDD